MKFFSSKRTDQVLELNFFNINDFIPTRNLVASEK